jgi:hypothetical protein
LVVNFLFVRELALGCLEIGTFQLVPCRLALYVVAQGEPAAFVAGDPISSS